MSDCKSKQCLKVTKPHRFVYGKYGFVYQNVNYGMQEVSAFKKNQMIERVCNTVYNSKMSALKLGKLLGEQPRHR